MIAGTLKQIILIDPFIGNCIEMPESGVRLSRGSVGIGMDGHIGPPLPIPTAFGALPILNILFAVKFNNNFFVLQ